MYCQFPTWRGKGEGSGAFAPLISRIFSQRRFGSETRTNTVIGGWCDSRHPMDESGLPFLPYPAVAKKFYLARCKRGHFVALLDDG
jgi:hypothetical protein